MVSEASANNLIDNSAGERVGQTPDRRVGESGRWFAVMWSLAVLFHLAANPAHLLALRSIGDGSKGIGLIGGNPLHTIGLAQLVLASAAVAVVMRPSATRALALSATYLLVLWLKLPGVGNHEMLLGLMAAAIAMSALASVGSRRSPSGELTMDSVGSWPLDWAVGAAATCRWILLISYSFIAFSKLNSGFFNQQTSCAAVFLDEFTGLMRLPDEAFDQLNPVAIVVIAAVELTIPVLLVLPRFRTRGAVLALVFHFVLALDPVSHVWDFSATLLPLFVLFMPPSFTDELDRWCDRLGRRVRSHGRRVPHLMAATAVGATATALVAPVPNWLVAYPLWLLVAGPIVFAAVGSVLSADSAPADRTGPDIDDGIGAGTGTGAGQVQPTSRLAERPLGRPILAIAGVAVVIGLGPYLELRSAASFNMYSNLQIAEGRSNHFVVGSLRSGRSSSTSEIVAVDPDSPLGYYVGTGLAVPDENLRRYLAEHPDENPIIVPTQSQPTPDSDDVAPVAMPARSPASPLGAEPTGTVAAVVDYLSHKLSFRRAIDIDGSVACQRAWGPLG